ncbi:HSF-type DNA-binding-domain-containing protein [Cunninghamella echinulata]|nr:HSF-type DNA-binding-domain-containing protein [Cunninghamella echinulata]
MTSTRKNQTSKRRRPSTVLPSTSASSRKRNTGPQVNVTNEIQDDSFKRGFRNIPAFLSKLYSMVDDDNTELIYWSEDGTSFIVEEQEAFSKTILPRYFKHNTFSSFVRQLNMYDFHKIPHVRQGVLVNDGEREHWEFQHPYFQRGKQDILHLVTRKKIRSTNVNATTTQQQLDHVRLGSLVKDISSIRQHQHAITTDLQHLHNDNEVLWREILLAREKHQRHQQVIERILLFLTTIFSNDNQLDIMKNPRFMLGENNEFISPSLGN